MSKPEPDAEREIVRQEEPVLPSPRDILATATGEISANLEPRPTAQDGRDDLESTFKEAKRSLGSGAFDDGLANRKWYSKPAQEW